MGILKPKLNNVEEESWEELENADIGSGAPSLLWLVWVRHALILFSSLFMFHLSTLEPRSMHVGLLCG